ncbi:hypothetical protein scyTo_0005244 [Scyliorhinus torazame]|uniref:Uncharacterized protein n=1 Tax=Scyliorhinus torazame TaxID=75743 RepID=A0A401P4L5_SCYTO|nr:hypothetical protein [Scyliorhinus torazame]
MRFVNAIPDRDVVVLLAQMVVICIQVTFVLFYSYLTNLVITHLWADSQLSTDLNGSGIEEELKILIVKLGFNCGDESESWK